MRQPRLGERAIIADRCGLPCQLSSRSSGRAGRPCASAPARRADSRRAASPTAPCWAVISGEPCGGLLIALAGRQRHDLRLARALEKIEADEAFADILADRERAVVAQDHRILRRRDRRPAARARRGRPRRLHNRGRRDRRGSASPSASAAAAPSPCADTACPAGVCKCITACASSRAMWIAEWMVKPAGLVMNGVGSTGLPLDVDLDQRATRSLPRTSDCTG